MPANAKAGEHLTRAQKTALRWNDQAEYLKKTQLYPIPSAELDTEDAGRLDGHDAAVRLSSPLWERKQCQLLAEGSVLEISGERDLRRHPLSCKI